MSTFADLGVPARMVEALAADGIIEPFPVQSITLPDALAGKDLCGRAPTGSGKTLGFGIPMMVRISQAEPNKPTGLVLVPTRELAEQVQKVFVTLGRAQWRFVQAIYGGASFGPQIHSLRKGASVVVATPGRLLDIIEKGHCDLSAVEVCVIDEADRMADLGFMPDLRSILDMTPATRQTMLWSATLDGDVKELIRDYMKDPVRHDLLEDVEAAPVDHKFVVTRPSERLDSAVALIEEHGPTVVFVKTRYGVDDVSDDLNRAGVKAGALHGARSQAIRQRVLDDFKRGKLQALVATDVAARGIHVDNVSLVLHYDLPDSDKDYTHRSGRTGRAGNTGLVVAFVPPSRQQIARRMSNSINGEVIWEQGETPIERVPAGERSTGNRDRGDNERGGYRERERTSSYGDRGGYGDRDRVSSYGDRDRGGHGDRDRASGYARRDGGARESGGYRGGRDSGGYNGGSYGGGRDAQRGSFGGGRDNAGRDTGYRDRPRTDPNDWSPRPRRDDATPARAEWTPRPRHDDAPSERLQGWAPPQTPRHEAPTSGSSSTPRPRRDDDRTNERGRTDRSQRSGFADRSDRPAFNPRSDRPTSDRPTSDRPTSDRPWKDRPTSDRPAFNRGDRPTFNRGDRPAFNRGDRPEFNRGDRPTFNPRGDRPEFNRGDRPTFNPRSDRPAFNRGDRPTFNRSDRPAFNPRSDRPTSDRPTSDRPWKDRDDSRPPRTNDDRPWTTGRPAGPRSTGFGAGRPAGNAGARRSGPPTPRNAGSFPRGNATARPKRK